MSYAGWLLHRSDDRKLAAQIGGHGRATVFGALSRLAALFGGGPCWREAAGRYDITAGPDTPGRFTGNSCHGAHNRIDQCGPAPEWRKQLIRTTKPGRNGTVRVTFALPADEPRGAVSVVGDFNGWNPFAHPLQRRANGTRSAAVTVPTGSMLRFRYLAEGGVWFDDETAPAQDGQDASIAV